MLLRAQEIGTLSGYCIGMRPPISHMLFADDSLFFAQAYESQANKLREIFSLYEVYQGQTINFEKSNIFFNGPSFHVHIRKGDLQLST